MGFVQPIIREKSAAVHRWRESGCPDMAIGKGSRLSAPRRDNIFSLMPVRRCPMRDPIIYARFSLGLWRMVQTISLNIQSHRHEAPPFLSHVPYRTDTVPM